jgi:hypothetical protein
MQEVERFLNRKWEMDVDPSVDPMGVCAREDVLVRRR